MLRNHDIHFKNQTWADKYAVSLGAPNGRVFLGGVMRIH